MGKTDILAIFGININKEDLVFFFLLWRLFPGDRKSRQKQARSGINKQERAGNI